MDGTRLFKLKTNSSHWIVLPLCILALIAWSSLDSFQIPFFENYRFYRTMNIFLDRLDAVTPEGSTLLFGDSNYQPLPLHNIMSQGVNFSVGGETSRGLLSRLEKYGSVRRAKHIIVAVGTNDIAYHDFSETRTNFERLLRLIPETTDVTLVEVLPVNTEFKAAENIEPFKIKQLNVFLRNLCAERSRCNFLSFQNAFGRTSLRPELTLDGIHLSTTGRKLLIDELARIFHKIP